MAAAAVVDYSSSIDRNKIRQARANKLSGGFIWHRAETGDGHL
jgi:hypothetical protein